MEILKCRSKFLLQLCLGLILRQVHRIRARTGPRERVRRTVGQECHNDAEALQPARRQRRARRHEVEEDGALVRAHLDEDVDEPGRRGPVRVKAARPLEMRLELLLGEESRNFIYETANNKR